MKYFGKDVTGKTWAFLILKAERSTSNGNVCFRFQCLHPRQRLQSLLYFHISILAQVVRLVDSFLKIYHEQENRDSM